MKTLFRILGTAAAVAVTGAAIVALDKILNQKDPLHVEEVEFPKKPSRTPPRPKRPPRPTPKQRPKQRTMPQSSPPPGRSRRPEAPAEPAAEAPAANEPVTLPDLSEERPVYDPEAPNPNPWRPAPPSPPRTRTASSTPPRSLTPAISATGKSRAARADLP